MRLFSIAAVACLAAGALAACNTPGNNTTNTTTTDSTRIDVGKAFTVLTQGVDAQAKLAKVFISTGDLKGTTEQTVVADVQKERLTLDAAVTAYHLTGADPSAAIAEVGQLMTEVSALLPAKPS